MFFKIQVSCCDVLDSKKVHIYQKTNNGVGIVQPVYVPAQHSIRIPICKLQFSRSTPLNKFRNLSDSYFQLKVTVSVIADNNESVEIATFISEKLNVLSRAHSQYTPQKSYKRYSTYSENSPVVNCSKTMWSHTKVDMYSLLDEKPSPSTTSNSNHISGYTALPYLPFTFTYQSTNSKPDSLNFIKTGFDSSDPVDAILNQYLHNLK